MDADATVFRKSCQRPIVTEFRLNRIMGIDLKEMTFGQRVAHFREGLNITQAELAEFAEVVPSTIGDIESGRTKSTPVIDLIAEKLEVSTKMLRYGEDADPTRHTNKTLSPRETKLIDLYRQLSGTSRNNLDYFMMGLPKKSAGKIAGAGDRSITGTKLARSRRSG